MLHSIAKIKCMLLAICSILIGYSANAQVAEATNYWSVATFKSNQLDQRKTPMPEKFKSLKLDFNNIKLAFANAPLEQLGVARNSVVGTLILLPLPDGSFSTFEVIEVPMMQEPLASTYPFIKTFIATQRNHPEVIARLDYTLLGFHAMIMDPAGWSFIEPVVIGNTADYICYYKMHSKSLRDFDCAVEGNDNASQQRVMNGSNLNAAKTNGINLRTYRLALACTGEYAAFFGGTKAAALSAMVTSVNRVSAVYESEVSIRLTLIGNDSLLVYTSTSDPYTNNNGSTMLAENQSNITTVIGSANYDIGHVFSTGGGGVAGLGVVCNTSNKARGVTGSTAPVGDNFDIDYVAHEMGHQFSGNHTFNSVTGSCGGGNRNASTAMEVGSGITIMAYAGICTTDDLAAHSIAYFHTKSFEEIVNFSTTGNGNTCAVLTATGNSLPVVVTLGSNFSIPISTPFTLTGVASDANAGDVLTYSWEEVDTTATGGAYNQTQVANTDFPLFRPFAPVSSPSRTFPKISDIVTNTTTLGERLPTVTRLLDFRFTVRDNRAGGGGVTYNDVTRKLTTVPAAGPFLVTVPNTAVSWFSGTNQTVTWNVAGTTASPVSCANVKISLSNDGGYTYPTVIVASTANDGSESITVPGVITTQARIKVEAADNVFFDISDANFTIQAGSGSLTAITTSALASTNLCVGTTLSVTYVTDGPANAGNVFTAQLSDSSGSFTSGVTSIGSLTSINAGTITATIPMATIPGTRYRIRVISSAPVIFGANNGTNISIFGIPAAAGTISGSAIACQSQNGVAYSVASITNATGYVWTLPTGATIASGANTNNITVNFSASASSGNLSVIGTNAGCNGTISPNFNVTLNTLPAAAGTVTGTPNVCQTQAGATYSVPSISGAISYTWTVPSGASITNGINTNSITVTYSAVATSGNVSVVGTNACGNGVSSSFAVVVNPTTAPPVVSASGSTTVCTPATVALNFTPTAGVNYQWRLNGANISGATSSTYTATQTGNYDVVATGSVPQTFTNATYFAIPDNNCTGATSPIAVSGFSSTVNSSNIYIKIDSLTHTYIGDLVLFLQAPNGSILGLSNRVGSSGDNFINTVFADSGSVRLPTTGAPYTGLYKPWTVAFTSCITSTITTFAALGGGTINPNGNWTLRAYDRVAVDSGIVRKWSIVFPSGGVSLCSSTSNSIGVIINPTPAISNFSPSSGTPGTQVVITGSGFTNTSAVQFNGVSASYIVNNNNSISATVPANATTGLLSVTTACGTVNSASTFTVISIATINIKFFIEGYYQAGRMQPVLFNAGQSADTSITDTVQIALHDTSATLAVDTVVTTVVSRDGNASFTLPSNKIGNSYYVAILYKNAIETWSKLPITIGSNTSFDFTP